MDRGSTGSAGDAAAPALSTGGETVRDQETFEAQFAELLANMGVRLVPEQHCLEVPGWVNMREGLIEVFACAPGGKVHESVVVLDCIPSGIHAGLLALGMSAGRPVEQGTGSDYRPPEGEGVIIEVVYQNETGETRRVRAEDWILDLTENRSMQHVAWPFTGSFVQPNPAQDAESYAADYVKSIVTTYQDPSTVIENPLLNGQDDTLYYVNKDVVPDVRTPVTVIFTPAIAVANAGTKGESTDSRTAPSARPTGG